MSIDPSLSISLKHWDVSDVEELSIGSSLLKVNDEGKQVEVIVDDMNIIDVTELTVYNLITADHTFIANDYCVFDDFPDIEKHPEISMKVLYTAMLMKEGLPLEKALTNATDIKVDITDFETQFLQFLEIAKTDNEFIRLANTLWSTSFEMFFNDQKERENKKIDHIAQESICA